jgi:hypothetical protein
MMAESSFLWDIKPNRISKINGFNVIKPKNHEEDLEESYKKE